MTRPRGSGRSRATHASRARSSSCASAATLAQRRAGGLVGAGDEHAARPALEQRARDRGDLVGRLALGEDRLGRALARLAVRVDAGEPQINERPVHSDAGYPRGCGAGSSRARARARALVRRWSSANASPIGPSSAAVTEHVTGPISASTASRMRRLARLDADVARARRARRGADVEVGDVLDVHERPVVVAVAEDAPVAEERRDQPGVVAVDEAGHDQPPAALQDRALVGSSRQATIAGGFWGESSSATPSVSP